MKYYFYFLYSTLVFLRNEYELKVSKESLYYSKKASFSCALSSSTVKHIGYYNNHGNFFNYEGFVGTVHNHES